MSSDGLHLTQPGEDGRGPARCMAHALKQGGLEAKDVAYINAHATSTPLGDAAEQRGIAAAFGTHATGRLTYFSMPMKLRQHLHTF